MHESLVERRRMTTPDRVKLKNWGRTGFDLESYARLQAEDNGWPLKTSIKNIYANNDVDMAPSLAEADEILARFGWAEEAALAA